MRDNNSRQIRSEVDRKNLSIRIFKEEYNGISDTSREDYSRPPHEILYNRYTIRQTPDPNFSLNHHPSALGPGRHHRRLGKAAFPVLVIPITFLIDAKSAVPRSSFPPKTFMTLSFSHIPASP